MAALEAKTEGVTHVFVVVNPPYQVVDHGKVFGPGETAEVPEDVAAHWIHCGWVVAK
jgi:hypothetical protein